jgi:hypothetical protein
MSHTLTVRAEAYLAGLQRVRAPQVALVEERLKRLMPSVPTVWLAFHERFSGYVQLLGQDSAVLGLMHRESQWMTPMECEVEEDPGEDDVYVTCADVHPSYSFQLTKHGHFLGQPASSFEIYIERCALAVEFKTRASPSGFDVYWDRESLPAGYQDDLLATMRDGIVSVASDDYRTVYLGDNMLVKQVGDRLEILVKR